MMLQMSPSFPEQVEDNHGNVVSEGQRKLSMFYQGQKVLWIQMSLFRARISLAPL